MKNVIKTFILLAFFGLSSLVNAQWQQTNGPYGGNINCIASDGTNIFAGTNGQGVFLSSNNGSSWTAVNNGLPGWSPVYSLAISGSNIFAGTGGGGVWKRALSDITGIEDNNYKSNITLYPNPANNKVTITNNNLPAKETTISIFNIQGELMLSEKFKEQNAIELNISKFAGGIYILKIQIGNEIENKKLVIQ